ERIGGQLITQNRAAAGDVENVPARIVNQVHPVRSSDQRRTRGLDHQRAPTAEGPIIDIIITSCLRRVEVHTVSDSYWPRIPWLAVTARGMVIIKIVVVIPPGNAVTHRHFQVSGHKSVSGH